MLDFSKYEVIDTVVVEGKPISVLDIPQITDEEWQRMAAAQNREQAAV